MSYQLPDEVGLGFRSVHGQVILERKPQVPWFEVLADNYIDVGGAFAHHLSCLSESYPLTFHCVGMSLGGTSSLNMPYLSSLKKLIDRFEPVHVSDHLAWSNLNMAFSHDLLPVAYTEESFANIVGRVNRVQDFLGRKLLIENISMYVSLPENTIPESEFISRLCDATGCGILLDINNLIVNKNNLGWSLENYFSQLDSEYVHEIHIGGYEVFDGMLVDTHGSTVSAEALELYQWFIQKYGSRPTLLEWDNNIPDFQTLKAERNRIADAALLATVCRKNLTYGVCGA